MLFLSQSVCVIFIPISLCYFYPKQFRIFKLHSNLTFSLSQLLAFQATHQTIISLLNCSERERDRVRERAPCVRHTSFKNTSGENWTLPAAERKFLLFMVISRGCFCGIKTHANFCTNVPNFYANVPTISKNNILALKVFLWLFLMMSM